MCRTTASMSVSSPCSTVSLLSNGNLTNTLSSACPPTSASTITPSQTGPALEVSTVPPLTYTANVPPRETHTISRVPALQATSPRNNITVFQTRKSTKKTNLVMDFQIEGIRMMRTRRLNIRLRAGLRRNWRISIGDEQVISLSILLDLMRPGIDIMIR